MSWRIAAALGVLAVLAAVGVGLGLGRLVRPSPTPVRVSITFAPAPTASRGPVDEATLFRQPISSGCSTRDSIWVVTNGGGVMRYDGVQWSLVDSTLRSLVRVSCSSDAAYAVGPLGAVVVGDEPTRDRKSTRLNSSHIQKSRMPSSA